MWIRAPGLPGKVGAGRPGLVPCLVVESGSAADSAPAWEAGTSLRQRLGLMVVAWAQVGGAWLLEICSWVGGVT